MVGRLLYASRKVKGPRKLRITVPGALPGLRSMLKGPLFQVCHDNVAMPSSLWIPLKRIRPVAPSFFRVLCGKGWEVSAKTRLYSIGDGGPACAEKHLPSPGTSDFY
jgi:hypothetical protein